MALGRLQRGRHIDHHPGPYSRLYYMALAVSTPGSEFYGNDSLKRDVIDGMDWMEANRYNPSIPLYDNWWMFVIGHAAQHHARHDAAV